MLFIFLLFLYFSSLFSMEEVSENRKVDPSAFSKATDSLHSLICRMNLQNPDKGTPFDEQIGLLINESLENFNIFARDIEQCGSKRVPWKFYPCYENRIKQFFSNQMQDFKSAWDEDKVYCLEPEQFTREMLDIVMLFQKKLIHAGICFELQCNNQNKYPLESLKEQSLRSYSNLRQLFFIQKQLVKALGGQKIEDALVPNDKKLNTISTICKNEIEPYSQCELQQQHLLHNVGKILNAGAEKTAFGHAVVGGILQQENLSSAVASIIDPAISAENLQRIENSSIAMALMKIFAKKKYDSIQNGIDNGVPPSTVIKGVREFIDQHPPLGSLKPPILKILRNSLLSTWVIDPVACFASFCWRPLQYPMEAVKAISQEMMQHQLMPNPSFILQKYLKESVEIYHLDRRHLLNIPVKADKISRPFDLCFPTDYKEFVSKFFLTKTEEKNKAIEDFVLKHSQSFDSLYKRYLSYRVSRSVYKDNLILEMTEEQIFNYWLRGFIKKQIELESVEISLDKKRESILNRYVPTSLKNIESYLADSTDFKMDYVSDPVSQAKAAWLSQYVDPLFGYNLKPELRKLIKK